jgi:hypothetical protein
VNEPVPGAWLAPAFDAWRRCDELVRAVSAVLMVIGLGIGLLYVGAYLERRHLKAQLEVIDGGVVDVAEGA